MIIILLLCLDSIHNLAIMTAFKLEAGSEDHEDSPQHHVRSLVEEVIIQLSGVQQHLPTQISIVAMSEIQDLHLFSAVLAGPAPPVPDSNREADHEDESIHAEHKHRVLLLNNPGRKANAKLHCLRPIRVAIVLPIVPGENVQPVLSILMFAPSCLICQCVIGFFQLHEEFVIASRFVRVVDQRQLLVLRLDLLLIRRDTHLVHV